MSKVNYTCMVGLADKVGLPHKSRMADSIIFKLPFVSATGQLTSHGVGAKAFDVHRSKAN